MGRIRLSIAILIMVLGISICSVIFLSNKTAGIIELARKTQDYADKGEAQKALEHMGYLENEWESYQNMASIFVRNEKISGVQTSMVRLRSLILNKSEELDAEFAGVISGLEWIVESEIPRITNIL